MVLFYCFQPRYVILSLGVITNDSITSIILRMYRIGILKIRISLHSLEACVAKMQVNAFCDVTS